MTDEEQTGEQLFDELGGDSTPAIDENEFRAQEKIYTPKIPDKSPFHKFITKDLALGNYNELDIEILADYQSLIDDFLYLGDATTALMYDAERCNFVISSRGLRVSDGRPIPRERELLITQRLERHGTITTDGKQQKQKGGGMP